MVVGPSVRMCRYRRGVRIKSSSGRGLHLVCRSHGKSLSSIVGLKNKSRSDHFDFSRCRCRKNR